MIGNFITVQQLYDYAVRSNYLKADAKTVLDIMRRENSEKIEVNHRHNYYKSFVSPTSNSSTVNFSTLVEYTTEDLLALFSI